MAAAEFDFFDKKPSTKNKKRKRKHPDELVWQAQYINTNNELIASLNVPLHVYNQKKDICQEPKQQKFLKKFKTVELPYILNETEKEIFDSLKCDFLFVIKQTDNGWEISPSPSLPMKMINIDAMWKQ